MDCPVDCPIHFRDMTLPAQIHPRVDGPAEVPAPVPLQRASIIDSHTAGEPTRLVLSGGPELVSATMAERLGELRARFPDFRNSVVAEPRGSDVIVGALLCPPEHADSIAGVIFFNDVGYLGMCGHGTIGLVHSLAHLGRITPGEHRIDTPAGTVSAHLHPDGSVTVRNVPSWRYRARITVEVPEIGQVVGDVAWGGNWFFLIRSAPPLPLTLAHVRQLTRLAAQVRDALGQADVTGPLSETVDHIEWFAGPATSENHSRNFVLCPGAAYDRSPCGTGTSAKLACLAADGLLAAGEVWRQEGILGTVFTASYELLGGDNTEILPSIKGRAYVTAESTLLFDDGDPFRQGIPTT
jgi:4-hydroxyproline epimerase